MRANAVFRIRFITGVILFLALVLIGKLYFIQVVHGADYRAKAEKQYVHTVQGLYSRGTIFMTTKDGERVAAATIQSGYLLAVDPSRIKDPEAAYTSLSSVISLDHDTFIADATKTDRTYVEVDDKVSSENATKIDALKIPGVMLYRNQWRYYPGGDLAARTIGFVGYQGNSIVGLYGLERYYNDVLTRDNNKLSVNFFAELFSNLGNTVVDNTTSQRGDIVTTLEPTVERELEKQLNMVQDKWHSKLSGGIIIDPKNGEVYALGIEPSFDLNDRAGVSIDTFSNPLVENVYEMGSIIKALTMASGLDSGAVTTKTTYDDTGCIEVDKARICNYDFRARGVIPMQQVLNQSLNVGAAFVEKTMGNDTFRTYFTNLKLGSETGIDLPGETYGLVKNLQSPRDVEYRTASFGQGIAMTPIETVRALSALPTGRLITPHLVKEIDYENGTKHTVEYPPGEQVFKPSTAETITRMLVEVADVALRNGTVKKQHYAIGTKTGTAQIADPVHGGYYADLYLHSFFGYFPAYDPRFLIFLYTDEPQGVKYASETLTDPFMNLVDFLINYYDIPPDR